jgi:hypothetical protein
MTPCLCSGNRDARGAPPPRATRRPRRRRCPRPDCGHVSRPSTGGVKGVHTSPGSLAKYSVRHRYAQILRPAGATETSTPTLGTTHYAGVMQVLCTLLLRLDTTTSGVGEADYTTGRGGGVGPCSRPLLDPVPQRGEKESR